MFWSPRLCAVLLLALAIPWVAGCSEWFGASEDELTEEVLADSVDGSASPDPAAAAPSPASPSAAAPAPIASSVNYVKSITQFLRQRSPQGATEAKTSLDMALTLSARLDAGGAGGQSCDLRLTRFRISNDLPGEAPLRYNSQTDGTSPPAAARLYHGMINRGFAIRFDANHRLAEVSGAEQFLEQVLAPYAPADQARLRADLPFSNPQETLSWLLDESLRLLPASPVKPGDQWVATQQSTRPAPLDINTRYTLTQINGGVAEIKVNGKIAPTAGAGVATGVAPGVQIVIRGGDIEGHYQFDLQAGLPISSRVEQSLEMTVRLADGSQFDQSRTTVAKLVRSAETPPQSNISLTGGSGTAPSPGGAAPPIRE